ncbi:MAG: hypothetical protein ACRC23_02030 [Aeromonas jandaei]
MSVDPNRLNKLVECLDLKDFKKKEQERITQIAKYLLMDCCEAVDCVRKIQSDNIFSDIYRERMENTLDTMQLVLSCYGLDTRAIIEILRYQ